MNNLSRGNLYQIVVIRDILFYMSCGCVESILISSFCNWFCERKFSTSYILRFLLAQRTEIIRLPNLFYHVPHYRLYHNPWTMTKGAQELNQAQQCHENLSLRNQTENS